MIVAKVASLIDERTLVLNKGRNNGVHVDMYFMIYAAEGKKIIDPDTQKDLGTLKLPKLSVRVTEVFPAYSIAETYKYRTVNKGGTNSSLASISGYFAPPKYVKEYETFSIDKHDKKAIDEARSIIKVGDIAEEQEKVTSEDD